MKSQLSSVNRAHFDVAIIGGGVTGSALFYELSMRAKRCVIVDHDHFASGASENMQRILHGGFRYMQKGDIKRIISSIKAVNRWQYLFPHWVKSLEATIPIKNKGIQRPHFLKVATLIYNQLAKGYVEGDWWRPAGIRQQGDSHLTCELGIRAHGELYFFDAVIEEPKKACLALIRDAVDNGGSAFDQSNVTTIADKKLTLECQKTRQEAVISADRIVVCTGPKAVNIEGLPQEISQEFDYLTGLHLISNGFDALRGSVGIDYSDGMLFASRCKEKVLFGSDWQKGDIAAEIQIERIRSKADGVIPSQSAHLRASDEYHQGIVPCDVNGELLERPIQIASGDFYRLITNKYTTALIIAAEWADRYYGKNNDFIEKPLLH